MPPLPPHLILVLVASSILAGALAALAILIATQRAEKKELPEKRTKHQARREVEDQTTATAIGEVATNGTGLIQTLTKTFAQLSVGIAIFDSDRRLVLFNPSMMDLSTLPVEVLSRRPKMTEFFDLLRAQGILPEPRNYSQWKEQFTTLGSGSSDMIEELWSLPSGLTYRITFQAFKNGNLSMLVEDISNELSATRGIRARVRQNESVLNSFDEPLCVFSGNGQLSFSNKAFRDRWGSKEFRAFSKFNDAIVKWQSHARSDRNWARLTAFSEQIEGRKTWSFDTQFDNGDDCRISVHPVSGGGTMIRFQTRDVPAHDFEKTYNRLQVDRSQSIFATDGTPN